jgi:hypothetical protein
MICVNCSIRVVLASIFACIAVACDPSSRLVGPSSSSNSAGKSETSTYALTYELKSVDDEIADERSPFGYWTITKTYPVIKPEDAPVAQVVNARTRKLVDSLSCEGEGEETFTSENVYLGAKIFSMQYEAMWMCSSMPSPDSTSGALNIELTDGVELTLNNQFKSGQEYTTFVQRALTEFNKELKHADNEKGERCSPATELGDFHVDADAIIVHTPSRTHGGSVCDIAVRIKRKSIEPLLKPESVLQVR